MKNKALPSFQGHLLPLKVTGGLCLGNSLDEKLLRPSCSDLVLLAQTLSCASDKGHRAGEIRNEGGKGNTHTSLLESISDMLDVTCGTLLSLQRRDSRPVISSDAHCISLPQPEAHG